MAVIIVSYNMHGWNNGNLMVGEMRNNNDIILLQEHWLYPSTLK